MGIVAAMEAMLLNDADSALGRKICRLREMSIRRRRTRSQIHRRSIWRSGHMSRVGLTSKPCEQPLCATRGYLAASGKCQADCGSAPHSPCHNRLQRDSGSRSLRNQLRFSRCAAKVCRAAWQCEVTSDAAEEGACADMPG